MIILKIKKNCSNVLFTAVDTERLSTKLNTVLWMDTVNLNSGRLFRTG